jgi:hypothetical protein
MGLGVELFTFHVAWPIDLCNKGVLLSVGVDLTGDWSQPWPIDLCNKGVLLSVGVDLTGDWSQPSPPPWGQS